MSQDKYIVIGTKPNTPLMYCLSDLYLDERVIFIEQFAPIKNKILNYIRHAHTGKRINHIINLPFKSIWHSPIDDIVVRKRQMLYCYTLCADLLSLPSMQVDVSIRNKCQISEKRKAHSESFKRQVAFEAMDKEKTVSEIAVNNNVTLGMVYTWKEDSLLFLQLFMIKKDLMRL